MVIGPFLLLCLLALHAAPNSVVNSFLTRGSPQRTRLLAATRSPAPPAPPAPPASPASRPLFKPEVLAPAGGWPQVKAAVANGADAVYFGLQEGFNARARASNFAIDEVEQLMSYLHERGLRGYTVVNILVFDEEFQKLEEVVKKLAAAGVDALIMQDVGAAAFVRRVCPNLPVHGSTQMTITDAHGAVFAESLGLDRVVVGRELSISEIESVSRGSGVEVEAFVHGALCVSYSGQCFSSEAWGGRSANRGQCAQACRMPYGLVVNGTLRELQDVQYLLSPQDLMAVDFVPELIQAGVRSFKIEGRLKGPEYVAITTKAYREAVDVAWQAIAPATAATAKEEKEKEERDSQGSAFSGPDDQLRRDLKQVFSRGQDEEYDGLSAGFLQGVKHQELVRGRNPRHRGLLLGKVQGVTTRGVIVALSNPLKLGEGVVFDAGRPEQKEEGGLVYEIFDEKGKNPAARNEERSSGRALLTFGSHSVDFSRVAVGDRVWKTKDPALDQRLKHISEKGDSNLVQVHADVSGSLGKPLTITLTSSEYDFETGSTRVFTATTKTQSSLSTAQKQPITRETLINALGTLGDTALLLQPDDVAVSAELMEGLFVPATEIKAARREVVAKLMSERIKHGRGIGIVSEELLHVVRSEAADVATSLTSSEGSRISSSEESSDFSLTCLCRSPEQVEAACAVPWLREITLDFLEVHGLREATKLVQQSGKRAVVATPRIIKPEEERLYSFYLRLRADAILVRSAGFLQQLLDLGGPGAVLPGTEDVIIPAIHGDFSLNSANLLSSAIFLKAGVSRLTASHDLNADQIVALGHLLQDASMLEVVVYQHLPIFHTEHCVFCRFLSDGNSYKDCGKPCESNRVHLRGFDDGLEHLVLADQGCRNTVFNAKAQSGAEYIPGFLAAGVRRFRIEFVDEPASSVGPILEQFKSVCLTPPDDVAAAVTLQSSLSELLSSVPNGNGLAQGSSPGSLLPQEEKRKSKGEMKVTAAEKRARSSKGER